SIPSKDALLK
uniref:SODEFRIN=FEMALE attractant pheromone n=1 Tax=Cynops pyrrhogaster TaxID=8330 RepID=Q9PRU1_CYNPY|nr:sodefrin=female attractant pheromone [Cynops pyrrhogaster=red-bellied newt, males, cloacal abdominal gland epithelial cells, Peptide, 10 aa] [Cynops pyrrhogaster]